MEAFTAEALTEILAQPEVARWWPRYDHARVRDVLVESNDTTVYVITLDTDVIGSVQYVEEPARDYRHASLDLFLDAAQHGGYLPQPPRSLGAQTDEHRARGHPGDGALPVAQPPPGGRHGPAHVSAGVQRQPAHALVHDEELPEDDRAAPPRRRCLAPDRRPRLSGSRRAPPPCLLARLAALLPGLVSGRRRLRRGWGGGAEA